MSTNIKFNNIPIIILTATGVILTPAKLNANPPIPETNIADAMKIFLVLFKSTFLLRIILIPDEAINPYSTIDTPPVIHAGIVCNNAVNGVNNPKIIIKIAENH